MSRRGPNALAAVLLVAAACSAGCRLHMSRVDVNSPLSRELYESIELGVHDRGDVLERLGPPDQLAYTPTEIVFDYESASHRGTDLRFFIPSDVFPGPSPLVILQLPRIFFDPFEEPDEFRGTRAERIGRAGAEGATGLIPFARGADLLLLRGRRLRSDRLRVVLDRETLAARSKALRLATGEHARESLPNRALLQGN